MTLAANGAISGTPTAAGTASFTVQVKDSSNTTATKGLSITVNAATLVISTSSLPPVAVGAAYSQTLTATGGTGGNTWSLASGALPAGLTLAANGTISGTPTAAGTATFTVQVKDSSNTTATKDLSITVTAGTVVITTDALPPATVGAAYTATLTASGGAGGYVWSLGAGSLPAGVTLAPNGTLTGIPTTPGTVTFSVQVKDSAGTPATKQLA